MTLNEIIEQGRSYLALCKAIDGTRAVHQRLELSGKALRKHSDAMKGMDIDQLEAVVAACIGAAKWHERVAPCGARLGEAITALEDVMCALKANRIEEDEAAEHEAPYERLSGAQLGLRSI